MVVAISLGHLRLQNRRVVFTALMQTCYICGGLNANLQVYICQYQLAVGRMVHGDQTGIFLSVID